MKKRIGPLAFVLAALVLSPMAVEAATAPSTIAATKNGSLQGLNHQGILAFLGVPYAEAQERFVPAGAVKPWQGVRNATEYGSISLQSSGGGFPAPAGTMDNNAQNLNIWTPGLDHKKRAVLVWLHGGGFASGSAQEQPSYNGENLSRRGDVVVVSVNHRLNIVGHLDLSAYNSKYRFSANVGVLDLVASLQWIRDNIETFGGDPSNVTLFGESGGGAKILALMTSPYAKGLFQKGIVESGATESMGVNFTALAASRRLAEVTLSNLGLTKDTVEAIQKVPYQTLVEATGKAMITTAGEFGLKGALSGQTNMDWEPVVDGDFLPTSPVTSESFAPAGKDIPLLIGTNLNEWAAMGLVFGPDRGKTFSDVEIDQRLQTTYGAKKDQVVAAFLKAYPAKSKVDALYFDSFLRLPLLKIMTHKADQKGAPVYAYVFTFGSPLAVHTAEIPFVFHNVDNQGQDASRMADTMSDAWIAFAKTGKPQAPGLPTWEPYTRDGGATMVLDRQSFLGKGHDRPLLQLLAPDYRW